MQVATQQLQIRKADTDAEASSVKMRGLQAELQVWFTAPRRNLLLLILVRVYR